MKFLGLLQLSALALADKRIEVNIKPLKIPGGDQRDRGLKELNTVKFAYDTYYQKFCPPSFVMELTVEEQDTLFKCLEGVLSAPMESVIV